MYVQVDYLSAGDYPALDTVNLFEKSFHKPTGLQRKSTREKPMQLRLDLAKKQLWWRDPRPERRRCTSPRAEALQTYKLRLTPSRST